MNAPQHGLGQQPAEASVSTTETQRVLARASDGTVEEWTLLVHRRVDSILMGHLLLVRQRIHIRLSVRRVAARTLNTQGHHASLASSAQVGSVMMDRVFAELRVPLSPPRAAQERRHEATAPAPETPRVTAGALR